MGFAITWLACPEDRADDVLKRLGFSVTGETEEMPESPFSMLRLSPQWRVIWIGEYGCSFLEPRDLAKLSHDTDIVLCLVEEHVMASSAELWSQGARKWRVSHLGENVAEGLDIDGKLPASFPEI